MTKGARIAKGSQVVPAGVAEVEGRGAAPQEFTSARARSIEGEPVRGARRANADIAIALDPHRLGHGAAVAVAKGDVTTIAIAVDLKGATRNAEPVVLDGIAPQDDLFAQDVGKAQ